MTGLPLMEVMDRAERGGVIQNIDLSEYGRFDSDHGTLEEVHIPDRLMGNIRAGGVSDSAAADAFDAGRTAERKNQAETETDSTETVEPEVHTSEPPAKEAPTEETQMVRRNQAAGFWTAVAALGGAIGLTMVLQNARAAQSAASTRGQLESARREGFNGFFDGVRYNPYDPNSAMGRAYQQGWNQARAQAN